MYCNTIWPDILAGNMANWRSSVGSPNWFHDVINCMITQPWLVQLLHSKYLAMLFSSVYLPISVRCFRVWALYTSWAWQLARLCCPYHRHNALLFHSPPYRLAIWIRSCTYLADHNPFCQILQQRYSINSASYVTYRGTLAQKVGVNVSP